MYMTMPAESLADEDYLQGHIHFLSDLSQDGSSPGVSGVPLLAVKLEDDTFVHLYLMVGFMDRAVVRVDGVSLVGADLVK